MTRLLSLLAFVVLVAALFRLPQPDANRLAALRAGDLLESPLAGASDPQGELWRALLSSSAASRAEDGTITLRLGDARLTVPFDGGGGAAGESAGPLAASPGLHAELRRSRNAQDYPQRCVNQYGERRGELKLGRPLAEAVRIAIVRNCEGLLAPASESPAPHAMHQRLPHAGDAVKCHARTGCKNRHRLALHWWR